MSEHGDCLAHVLKESFSAVLQGWMREQSREGVKRTDLVSAEESEAQSRELLAALARSAQTGATDQDFDIESPAWEEVRSIVTAISTARTERGVTPTEMAWFITAMKQPLFEQMKEALADQPDRMVDQIWQATRIVDTLGLHAIEVFVAKREEIIERQRAEMNEVAAPVVKLWDRIVTVPLIGTLDSYRSQTVMENLLDAIVEREAEVAIIDITGVSTVDTLVAQHLLKTAAAVRLMGAECVICGVSPKIAQTVVHLGVDLPNVITRVDLESGLAYAFSRFGMRVCKD